MKKPDEKARALVRVQSQLRAIAELETRELQQKRADLEKSKAGLLATLGRSDAFGPIMLDGVARRLNRLSREAHDLARQQEQQMEKLRKIARRLECAEERARSARQKQQRDFEQRQLEDIIDAGLCRKDTSLG